MNSIARNKKKQWMSLGFIGVLLGITVWFLFRNQEIPQLLDLIRKVDIKYLLIGIGGMMVFFGCEALGILTVLNSFRYKLSFWRCYSYSLIDFYFSSITPGCCGGQPSQLYYMSRDGIELSSSSLTLLLFNMSYHVSALIIALTAVFIGGSEMIKDMGFLKYFMYYGAVIQIGCVVMYLLVLFSDNFAPKIIRSVVGLFCKIKIFRDKSAALAKTEQQITEYKRGAKYIKEHPAILIKLLLITTLHLLALYSIPFWVYKAFGLSGQTFLTIVAMQAALTLAMESLPIPGGVGVTEGSFMIVYGRIFGPVVLPAMLLCRGVNYYSCLMTGGVVSALTHGKKISVRKSICTQ